MDNKETKVVRIHDVQIDQDYMLWLGEIKARYRNAQIKYAVKVNAEQLLFNWQLGRDLVVRKAEERWGSGIVEQVSLDLQAEFPGVKGFSTTNLWYMKQWYQFYSAAIPNRRFSRSRYRLAGIVYVCSVGRKFNTPSKASRRRWV